MTFLVKQTKYEGHRTRSETLHLFNSESGEDLEFSVDNGIWTSVFVSEGTYEPRIESYRPFDYDVPMDEFKRLRKLAIDVGAPFGLSRGGGGPLNNGSFDPREFPEMRALLEAHVEMTEIVDRGTLDD